MALHSLCWPVLLLDTKSYVLRPASAIAWLSDGVYIAREAVSVHSTS